MQKFQPIKKIELSSIIRKHEAIVISGGEPLLKINFDKTIAVIVLSIIYKKKIYIYSNLTRMPKEILPFVKYVHGWTIGYHAEYPDQANKIKNNLQYLTDCDNVRIMAEETLTLPKFNAPVKRYKLNDCDISYKENWYILED